jgi:tetratricopeptide (TPR) repeat protein
MKICYRELAQIYDQTNRYESALKYYKLAIKSGYDDLYLALGNCMRKAKMYTEAQEAYLEAIKHEQYEAAQNLAEISYEEGKITEAIKFFELASAHQISRGDLFLGDIYYEKKRYDLAKKYYLSSVPTIHGEILGERLYRLG